MANLTHDAHPIPPEIETAIADYGDGTAEAADETLGTPEWQNAMRKRDGAWAAMKVAIAELARDKERLDWMQKYLATLSLESEEGMVVELDYIDPSDEGNGEEITLSLPIDGEWPDLRKAVDLARGVATRSGRESPKSERKNG